MILMSSESEKHKSVDGKIRSNFDPDSEDWEVGAATVGMSRNEPDSSCECNLMDVNMYVRKTSALEAVQMIRICLCIT